MDTPAALHRIKVGVPATVEHSSEAGPETGKWIAETTQVGAFLVVDLTTALSMIRLIEFYHFYGRLEIASSRERSASPYPARACHWLCQV